MRDVRGALTLFPRGEKRALLARARVAAAESFVQCKAQDWARRTLSGWRLHVEHVRWVEERAGRMERDGRSLIGRLMVQGGVVLRVWNWECRRRGLARWRAERGGHWRANGLVAKFAIESWRCVSHPCSFQIFTRFPLFFSVHQPIRINSLDFF